MSTVKTMPPRFRLGEWVTFQYGVRPVFAQIIEDRGPIGADRRRLYRIRLDQDMNESISFEMPEDEMEKAVPEKAAILRYLKQGGLRELLRLNGGGPIQNQPKVWLTFDPHGRISCTFSAEQGLVGTGATPPFNGTWSPYRWRDVETFLESFGLSREEVSDVMNASGLFPASWRQGGDS